MTNKDLVRINGDLSNETTRRREPELPAPYRDMTRWMGPWDQWFDSMFNRMMSLNPLLAGQDRPGWGSSPAQTGSYVPAVNVTETEKGFKVTAELPGIDPADVELTFDRGMLSIRGEKKQEHEENQRGHYRLERSYGAFQRSIQLPEGVDSEHVDASYKNGVLTVTLPKLPELQHGRKKINIKSEDK